MADNPAYKDEAETDFGGVDESRKSEIEITVESAKNELEDGEIPAPYAGMPAEVLLLHSRKKGWVIGRLIGWLAVITAFGTLIGLSVTIIVKSPPCLEFWEKSPIYQIYPRSFKDCDPTKWDNREICGDGIGDLLGIMEKLDYLDELGIKVVWMNPVYQSPQKDFGYDVQDYRKIDQTFGTDEDMEELIVEMHKHGIKLLMDFVPNHTSNQNRLFVDSVNRNNSADDYYVWVDGIPPEGCTLDNDELAEACHDCHKNDACPNNWQSVFAKNDPLIIPAWTYHPTREQYYYRAFSHYQPDLNLHNAAVVKELGDIIAFWMDKGVDGFRVDAIGYAFENEGLRDEVKKDDQIDGFWYNLYHDFTYEYGIFHDLIVSFRKVMDIYSTEPGVDRLMITEATSSDVQSLMRYYGVYDQPEADFPMNFGLMALGLEDRTVSVDLIRKTIQDWMEVMPEGRVPNWIISSHDESRILSRFDLNEPKNTPNVGKLMGLLLMTLPGTPFVYYGQEIGMVDLDEEDHPVECQVDVQDDSRDKVRSPMRWDVTSQYAGFSDCSNPGEPSANDKCPICPWLPVGKDVDADVAKQQDDANSIWRYYQWLIKDIRGADEYTRGELCTTQVGGTTQRYFRRMEKGDIFEIVINWSEQAIDFSLESGSSLVTSPSGTEVDDIKNPRRLNPYSGVIVRRDTAPDYEDLTCFQRRPLKIGLGGIVFKK